jgi:hypothetical protein
MPLPAKITNALDTLGEFLYALIRHWRAFLSSSLIVGALLNVYERASGKSIALSYYLGLLLVGLVVACFTVWLEEYNRRLSVEQQLAASRPRLKLSVVRERERNRGDVAYFLLENFSTSVAVNVIADIAIPLTPYTIRVRRSPVAEEPDAFLPELLEDGKPWTTHESSPFDSFMLKARLSAAYERLDAAAVGRPAPGECREIARFVLTYKRRFRTPHVLTYNPQNADRFRIDLSDEPEPDPQAIVLSAAVASHLAVTG